MRLGSSFMNRGRGRSYVMLMLYFRGIAGVLISNANFIRFEGAGNGGCNDQSIQVPRLPGNLHRWGFPAQTPPLFLKKCSYLRASKMYVIVHDALRVV